MKRIWIKGGKKDILLKANKKECLELGKIMWGRLKQFSFARIGRDAEGKNKGVSKL